MGDLNVTGSGTGGSVSDASSQALPQTMTDGWKAAVDAAKAETNGWSSAPHPTWPGDDGAGHASGPSTGASASADKLSSFERASSCMRMAGGGLQFLAGGFAFLNVEVPVVAQAVGIAAMAHGASDMEIGSRQCFTGERGDDSLFQKTVSAAAQTAGADPQTAHRIGTATDIAAGFINPAGPITGAPGLVAQTANGARLGQEVTAAASLPSYVAGTSAALHAAAAPAQMVGEKAENDKTQTDQEVSEAKGEPAKKTSDKVRESAPTDAPSGTRPIDKWGIGRGDIHKIKDEIQAGPKDWVGISKDGDVYTTGPDGKAVNQGHVDDFTDKFLPKFPRAQ